MVCSATSVPWKATGWEVRLETKGKTANVVEPSGLVKLTSSQCLASVCAAFRCVSGSAVTFGQPAATGISPKDSSDNIEGEEMGVGSIRQQRSKYLSR